MSSPLRLLLPALLAVVPACGDDGGSAAPDSGTPDSGTPTIDGPPPGPAYAITTQILAADAANNQSYIIVTDRIDGGATLTLDNAIEVPGRALGAGPTNGGAVFVASDTGPTVTRYDLQADGTLAKGKTVSFQGRGLATITEYGGQFQFVSETKAYFFDAATAQVVIWNPRDMTVTGGVAMPELVVAGATLTFTAAPVRRDNQVITFAGWRRGLAVPSQTAVVVVDTDTDRVTVAVDTRCGYVRDGAFGADGKIYLATEAFGSAVHRLNAANAPAPCLLRFDPATRQFDAGFKVESNTMVGGAASGMLLRAPDGGVYLRVLDESLFPIQPDTNPRALASAAAWKWARLSLGDTPTATMTDAPATNGSVVLLELGDRSIVPIFEGRASTKLLELTANGPGAPALTVPGLVFSAVKLR